MVNRLTVVVLLCLIVTFKSLFAATYYVDQNHASASDSNAGTEISPWLTIQKAANVLVAGDTVFVKQGVYNEAQ